MSYLLYVLVRFNTSDVGHAISTIKQAWSKTYPDDPFIYTFLNSDISNLYLAEEARGKIFGTFAILAILIACLGLYGLASFTAEKRTREIGMRKVLGASIPDLMHLISRDFLMLILVANLIAWPVAYYVMNRWLDNFAYRVDVEPMIFMAAGILAIVIALLSVSYHAIRAALANPVDSLRYE